MAEAQPVEMLNDAPEQSDDTRLAAITQFAKASQTTTLSSESEDTAPSSAKMAETKPEDAPKTAEETSEAKPEEKKEEPAFMSDDELSALMTKEVADANKIVLSTEEHEQYKAYIAEKEAAKIEAEKKAGAQMAPISLELSQDDWDAALIEPEKAKELFGRVGAMAAKKGTADAITHISERMPAIIAQTAMPLIESLIATRMFMDKPDNAWLGSYGKSFEMAIAQSQKANPTATRDEHLVAARKIVESKRSVADKIKAGEVIDKRAKPAASTPASSARDPTSGQFAKPSTADPTQAALQRIAKLRGN
jgi:hypothetical protein